MPDGTQPLWRALLLAPWAVAGGSSGDERAGMARSGHDAVAEAVESADAAVAATGGDAAAEAEAAAWRQLDWAEKATRLLLHRYGMDVEAASEGETGAGGGGGGGGGSPLDAAPSLVERCRWEAAEEAERRELVALRHHREYMVRRGIERQRCAACFEHNSLHAPLPPSSRRCVSPRVGRPALMRVRACIACVRVAHALARACSADGRR